MEANGLPLCCRTYVLAMDACLEGHHDCPQGSPGSSRRPEAGRQWAKAALSLFDNMVGQGGAVTGYALGLALKACARAAENARASSLLLSMVGKEGRGGQGSSIGSDRQDTRSAGLTNPPPVPGRPPASISAPPSGSGTVRGSKAKTAPITTRLRGIGTTTTTTATNVDISDSAPGNTAPTSFHSHRQLLADPGGALPQLPQQTPTMVVASASKVRPWHIACAIVAHDAAGDWEGALGLWEIVVKQGGHNPGWVGYNAMVVAAARAGELGVTLGLLTEMRGFRLSLFPRTLQLLKDTCKREWGGEGGGNDKHDGGGGGNGGECVLLELEKALRHFSNGQGSG
ncbi:unnamed protein product [Discosporangium mesarthrocarpum]